MLARNYRRQYEASLTVVRARIVRAFAHFRAAGTHCLQY